MPAGGERRQSHRPLSRAGAPPLPASPRKGARSAAPNEAQSEPELAHQHAQQLAQQQQEELAALLAAQGGPPGGWDTLPPLLLDRIFNLLDPKSLAAAASVCSTWRYEANLDSRWRTFWQQEVSDSGLWRWAKADGGYRQQLRAKQLVRRGDCVATVFPFSRRDGPVAEVLFYDGGPRDADKRILTVQAPKASQSVRVAGSTLKVWGAAALLAQRPLLAVHDVLKHLQLEDGRLFLWRVAGDAVVLMHCSDPADEAGQEEAARWTEHPAIVASVLEPGAPGGPRLRDIPLEATYGRGVTPCDWLDMSSGLLAGSLMIPSQNRLIMRLFDVSSGRCLRASSCVVPEEDNMLNLQDHEITMITTRSGDAGSLLAATCALFDTRVFLWRQPDEWVVAQRQSEAAVAAGAAASRGGQQPHEQQGQQQEEQVERQQGVQQAEPLAEARAAAWDPAAIPAAEPPPPPAAPAGEAAAGGAAQQAQQAQGGVPPAGYYEVRHTYSMQDHEPIVDISISTTAARLFIVGMENIFVADLSGVPFMRVSMLGWRGVLPPGQLVGPADVGAFSWPLPNSTKTAFFLDATNSVFICEFRRPQVADYWFMQHQQDAGNGPAAAARRPAFDYHHAIGMQGGVYMHYTVQAHTDLRASPGTPLLSTQHGRAAGPRALEAGVVEYSQDGGVLFTTGETSCPAVAALLSAEKAAGAYLPGLGPAGARAAGAGRRGAALVRGGRGPRGKTALAPRALVMIDTSSGRRYKAVPLEGVPESVHSAGQYLVAAVAELGPSYPDSLNGSIVVLDFGGEGFGAAPPEAPARATPRGTPHTEQQQQEEQRRGRGPRQQGSSKAGGAGKRSAAAAAGRTQSKAARGAKSTKGQLAAKPSSGGRGSARRQQPAAAIEDEAGPSRKRGRR
ncbi:hypothetical protein ABPG77_007580 [Micractinium sp. CCAP 211/92]